MKTIFRQSIGCWALLVALGGPVSAVAATASYPTPTDTNGNGMIDSVEIQALLNTVTGVVFLPASKSYHIDATLRITKNGQSLVGEGPTTVLPITGDIEGILIAGGLTGCGVRHLKITGPAAHSKNAIRIDTCNETFAEDITIANTCRGIELVNGIGPLLANITMTGLTGDYGIKVDGTTKVDAAQLHGITGSASAATVEWLLIGRVDGCELQTANLAGGKRGIRSYGTVGPKYVYTNQVAISGTASEGVFAESGNDLQVNATTINNAGATAFRIGPAFIGGAVLTDLDISGAAGHGVQIEGGRDIGILEPVIDAPGGALPAGTGAGIKIAAGCSYVSITDGSARGQTYGILYDGTAAQSDANNVKMKNVDLTGNVIPFSPSNLEGAPLAPPAGLLASPGDSQVNLVWNAPASATSYKVKRATANGGPFAIIATTAAPAYVDTAVTAGTPYFYVITAVNATGESAPSAIATATPQASPAIVVPPVSQSITTGESIVFRVTATAFPAPSYQWRKDGSPIAGAEADVLAIPRVGYADAGDYTVVVSNSLGAVVSPPATLTVRDTTAPVLHLPSDLTIEATEPAGAAVTFAATATDDRDGPVSVTSTLASGSVFPIGTTTVTAQAHDSAGNVATGTFTVAVRDTTAPILDNLKASPDALWAPNHKLVTVTLTADFSDRVDPAPVVRIVEVTSNEPAEGSAPDWVITGPLTLQLRAERNGNATGRIYTITVEVRDHAGNATQRTVQVTVPHRTPGS
jgi:hypothetical protein